MGVVYVLSNPAMPGLLKIGHTTANDPVVRMGQLYNTPGVPLPFECERAVDVGDDEIARQLEKALHVAFGPSRVNPRREFFEIDIEQVGAILSAWPQATDVTPQIESNGNGVEAADKEAAERYKKRRPNLNFRELGIAEGSILTSIQIGDGVEQATVTVAGEKQVKLEGEEMSLSAATRIMLGMDANSPIRPTPYWMFQGRNLSDIYEETHGPRVV